MEIEYQNLTKKERRELRRQEKTKKQQQRKLKRMYRRIALWSMVLLGIGGAVFGIVKFTSKTPSNDGLTTLSTDSIAESDWVKGNNESAITLIEYSDFQCPACSRYYPILKQLDQEFGDSMQFAYRHFPLRQTHRNAELAARIAEAAGRQGKFWEMHDMIFENQKEWSNQGNAKETFITYAERLTLDIGQFKRDLDSKEVKDKVNNDYQSGLRSGVNSTPTFFLNGKKISNPRSYDEFRDIINSVINSQY